MRERKKLKTRRAIQDHALRLFAERGYEATTVEQIAAAAEISPSTFFRYFKTKEDVVVEDEYDPMFVHLFAAAPVDQPPVAAMRHVLREAFASMDAADLAKVLARAKLIMSVPALRARSFENMLRTMQMFGSSVAERLGRGSDDFAVRVFAGACFGTLMSAVFTWLESDGDADLGALADQALAHLEAGLPL